MRAALGPFTVNRVGFGAMQLPGPGVWGPPRDRAEAIAVVRRAVELGVDHIDTSEYYGPVVANELLREALHPFADNIVLVSKVGGKRDDKGGWLAAQKPEELTAGIDDNLRTLKVEQLGIVNLRRFEGVNVDLDDQLAAMIAARDAGKIAAIGISTAPLDEVNRAIDSAQIACVQNAFSLVDQRDVAVLDRCEEAGVAYVPYFPLGSGIPGLPKVADVPAVQTIAERLGATPAQVGLAWLLAQRPNVLLIPGTSRVAHLEENMAAADITLSEDDLALLAG